jgi:hypothetical protein
MTSGRDPSGSTIRPLLYCDDKWVQRLGWDYPARDASGDDIIDMNGNPVSLQDIQIYDQYAEPGEIPYWAEDLDDYFFDKDYGTKGYCGVTSPGVNLAGTTDLPSNPRMVAMTVCPRALSTSTATGKYQTLQQASAAVRQDQNIQRFQPVSLTIFHE